MQSEIRFATNNDLPAILELSISAGLFDEEGSAIISEKFGGSTTGIWLVAVSDQVVGVVYGEIEPVTKGTWNALMLAVRPSHQGKGIGRELMDAIESHARDRGGRVLLVETSSGEGLEAAREFYPKVGFREESRIQDYYADGHDKIIFWKRL